jgi:histidyl-tRNA synthetase
LRELDHTRIRIDEALRTRLRAFIIVADENRRPDAIRLAYSLRQSGIAVDYWFQPAKVGRQFQQAEALGAEYAVVVGPEWPQVRVKLLAERREELISKDELPALLGNK